MANWKEDIAVEVNRLINHPGSKKRFQEAVENTYQKHRQNASNYEDILQKRQEAAQKVAETPKLLDPNKALRIGYELSCVRLSSPRSEPPRLVNVWLPPKLAQLPPEPSPLIPFNPECKYDLEEKMTILLAFRDSGCEQESFILPRADKAVNLKGDMIVWYLNLLGQIRNLPDDTKLPEYQIQEDMDGACSKAMALRFLDDVKARVKPKNTGKGRPVGSKTKWTPEVIERIMELAQEERQGGAYDFLRRGFDRFTTRNSSYRQDSYGSFRNAYYRYCKELDVAPVSEWPLD